MSNLFVAGYDLYFDTLSMTNCLFFETCCIRCIPVLIRNKYGVLAQYYAITKAVSIVLSYARGSSIFWRNRSTYL